MKPHFTAPLQNVCGCFVNSPILIANNGSPIGPAEHSQVLKHRLDRRLIGCNLVRNPNPLYFLERPPFRFFLWRENIIRHLPSLMFENLFRCVFLAFLVMPAMLRFVALLTEHDRNSLLLAGYFTARPGMEFAFLPFVHDFD